MDRDELLAASRRMLERGEQLDEIAVARLIHANHAALQELRSILHGSPALRLVQP